MTPFSDADLRAYLLGRLDEPGAAVVEEKSIADEAFFEEIRNAEDELIDDFVRGELSPEDAERFARRNLRQAGMEERVLMRATFFAVLRGGAAGGPAADSARSAALPRRPARRFLIPGFALAAGVLIAVLVFAHWSSHPTAQLARAPLAAAAPQPSRSPSVGLPGPEALDAATVFFPQRVSRGTAQPAPLQLRLGSRHEVKLELELPATASAASALWSVTIQDAHGIVLVRRGLRARQFDGIPFVSTSFDASALPPGSYRVSLSQRIAHPASTEWYLKTIR